MNFQHSVLYHNLSETASSLRVNRSLKKFMNLSCRVLKFWIMWPLALRRHGSSTRIKEEGWTRGQCLLPRNTIVTETSTTESPNYPALAEDCPRKTSNNWRPAPAMRIGEAGVSRYLSRWQPSILLVGQALAAYSGAKLEAQQIQTLLGDEFMFCSLRCIYLQITLIYE